MIRLLNGFERSEFPVAQCTEPSEREDNVLGCSKPYICALIDDRFKGEMEFRVLYPYISWEEEQTHESAVKGDALFFGWVDKDCKNMWDHKERCIYGEHLRVVAWQPAEEGDETFDLSGEIKDVEWKD